jgi:hypothetical protein
MKHASNDDVCHNRIPGRGDSASVGVTLALERSIGPSPKLSNVRHLTPERPGAGLSPCRTPDARGSSPCMGLSLSSVKLSHALLSACSILLGPLPCILACRLLFAGDEIRGEPASGAGRAAALYSVDSFEDRTMMQSCASAASSGAAGPSLTAV